MDRHHRRRTRHKALKHDMAVLLDRITALYPTGLSAKMRAEIAEMQQRINPPPGVKVRTVYTNYGQRWLDRQRITENQQ